MAWFKRNKQNTIVLPELEKYYDAERRERSGLAWILALVSVSGVALILIGVFFGGRWTYRHFKNDKPQTVAVITQDTNNTTDQTDNSGAKDTTKTDTMSDANTTTPASPAVTPATTPTPAPSPASDTTTKLADTGPGDIAPAFMTATATGILIYRRKLAKTAKKA